MCHSLHAVSRAHGDWDEAAEQTPFHTQPAGGQEGGREGWKEGGREGGDKEMHK